MSLEPKHKNFKDKYKIKELVKKNFISGATCPISGSRMTKLPETSKLVTQSL
jgi:hypothetical protein